MKRYIGFFAFVFLISCSANKNTDLTTTKTPDELYKKALRNVRSGSYTDAAESFKEIDTLFSYSAKADVAHLLSGYAYFQASSYVDAMREIDIFLRYHPNHELVPYAKYLRATCILMQTSSLGRDQKTAKDARGAFSEVVERFPNSIYAEDCRKKIQMIDNILAGHAMSIGRYYQTNNSALAAISRYNYVATHMPDNVYVEEACYRVVECCLGIGLRQEAIDAYNVLKMRFPDGKWSKKADAIMKPVISKSVSEKNS